MTYLHDYDELEQTTQTILDLATSHGADQAQVLVYSNENIGTRFGENHISQNTQSNRIQFTLQSQIGEQMGNYSGSAAAGKDRLSRMVANALEIAKFSPPDPDFPGFLEDQPDYPSMDKNINSYEPAELASVIGSAIESALDTGCQVESVAGSINYNAYRTVLANSHGVVARTDESTVTGIINVAAREGEGESRSSEHIAGLDLDGLSLEETGRKVAERAVYGLNQGELDIGGYETIFSNAAFMNLLFHIGIATSSTMLINHQSPFKDKVGEQVFDEKLTIIDDTEDETHFSAQKFDFDGVPSRSISYIEEGVLKEFAYDRRNAKKLGVETNGRALGPGFALFKTPSIRPGSRSEEDLIASVDKGVYVSNLWYANFANMPEGSISGLTRDGLFKIEGGEIVGSVKNMRFTDTLMSIFGHAEPGNNIRQMLHGDYGNYYGLGGKVPSVRLDNFTFTSKGKH